MSERVEKLVEEIKGLTLLEAATLVKRLEETLGVSAAAAAPVVVSGKPIPTFLIGLLLKGSRKPNPPVRKPS